MPSRPPITFYFDVGSPFAYLAAERVGALLGEPVRWQPVLLGGIFKATGRSSWALGDPERRARGMADIERRAREYGLPALRWPDPWPADYLVAMRAATYAHRLGLEREFARAAFHRAFQHGAELSRPDEVLVAAQDAGLDRAGTQAVLQDGEIKQALREATDEAVARGVFGVPTVAVGDELFWGDDRLPDAVAAF
jgi:2-hydroxychromene-2-carboxylate isomerase